MAVFYWLFTVQSADVRKADAIDDKTKNASVTYKFTRNFPEKAKASFVSVKPVVVDFWDYVSGSVKKNYKESEKKSK